MTLCVRYDIFMKITDTMKNKNINKKYSMNALRYAKVIFMSFMLLLFIPVLSAHQTSSRANISLITSPPQLQTTAPIVAGTQMMDNATNTTALTTMSQAQNIFANPSSYGGIPYNPFYFDSSRIPTNGNSPVLPVGIANYGFYNTITTPLSATSDSTYSITTDEVSGTVDLSSLAATSNPSEGAYTSGLQLNTYLIFSYKGSTQMFWLQNVYWFANNYFQLADNIWNGTNGHASIVPGTLTNVVGSGSIDSYNGRNFYAYGVPETIPYTFPLISSVYIKILPIGTGSNARTGIEFGYKTVKNYDTVTCLLLYEDTGAKCNSLSLAGDINYNLILLPKGSTGATLITEPFTGLYSGDTEFVFGGPNSGATSTFSALNAELNLTYDNNGKLVNFPSYWTFGTTYESSTNIVSSINGGQAAVTTGTPNPLSGLITSTTLQQLVDTEFI